jgi:hypothetical protein
MLRSILYEVGAVDLAALGGATAILLACSLLASWIPARRASSRSPLCGRTEGGQSALAFPALDMQPFPCEQARRARRHPFQRRRFSLHDPAYDKTTAL